MQALPRRDPGVFAQAARLFAVSGEAAGRGGARGLSRRRPRRGHRRRQGSRDTGRAAEGAPGTGLGREGVAPSGGRRCRREVSGSFWNVRRRDSHRGSRRRGVQEKVILPRSRVERVATLAHGARAPGGNEGNKPRMRLFPRRVSADSRRVEPGRRVGRGRSIRRRVRRRSKRPKPRERYHRRRRGRQHDTRDGGGGASQGVGGQGGRCGRGTRAGVPGVALRGRG